MKTILVTGGAGFIGSNFVHYIYNKYSDYRVIVLDALTYAGNMDNLPQEGLVSGRLEFWYGDILNSDLVDSLVKKSDTVVHFAAESHVTRSIFDNKQFFVTDVLGTQVVVNSVLRNRDNIEMFVHISTSEVYGTAQSNTMAEDHQLNPMSPYAAAKCGADRLIHSYWKTYDLPTVIVRPFNNYGAYQHLEKVIPRFITSCLLDETLKVHGDGLAKRDFLYIDDHCEALDKLIHCEIKNVAGEVINLGTSNDISILNIAETIVELMSYDERQIRFVGDRRGQVFRHTCDWSKAKEKLDWQPSTSFKEGLVKTIAWYEKNPNWWKSQKWMRDVPVVTANGKKELQ
jgi:dTDP-glucose 4,6-dehydratase